MNRHLASAIIFFTATVLAYVVIVLGAYTRLSDAGLGCPDWPGCYGKIIVPADHSAVTEANLAFPERPLHHAKAWKEMVHRYAAATLGMIILLQACLVWLKRWRGLSQDTLLPTVLLFLVLFQGALGMWTVTLLLKPVIVAAHLLGGLSILSLLYWQSIKSSVPLAQPAKSIFTLPLSLAIVMLFVQIALGGWTSANYAALVCTDFPLCQGQWWPQMDFREGFVLWRGLGVDYEGGVLDGAARTAIHVSHRIGALLTFLIVGGISTWTILKGGHILRKAGTIALLLLFVQLSLGVANVLLLLPLPIAVAHNAVAALLLLSLVNLLYFSFSIEAQTGR